MAKIVIVDDEPSVLRLLGTFLPRWGHTFKQATNGREGLALVHQHHPDLLITDNTMPGMTGLELIAIARADPAYAHMKILLLTAVAETLKQTSHGADAILGKPFSMNTLQSTIERLLGQ